MPDKKVKLIMVTSITLMVYFVFCLYAPSSMFRNKKETVFTVPRGAALSKTVSDLKKMDLIRNRTVFITAAKIMGAERKIQAGDYVLTKRMSAMDILNKISSGDAVKSCFTIPEGYSLEKTADKLAGEGFIKKQRFIELAHDRRLAESLGVDADTVEGYLYPETYCTGKGQPEKDVITAMVRQFDKMVTDADRRQADSTGLTMEKIVIIASIIEKESGNIEEINIVSSVFHNRLKLGMPLQSCATVIYALGKQFRGKLGKADLEINSPYNTYMRNGLPPGPICSPGIKAIRAALHPAEVDYLYFVSMNNGRHKFSSTLDEHSAAVREYQAPVY